MILFLIERADSLQKVGEHAPEGLRPGRRGRAVGPLLQRGRAAAAPVRVHVSSPPGAALMFDGDLKHAGAHVVSGTRHLYVASFNRVHNE